MGKHTMVGVTMVVCAQLIVPSVQGASSCARAKSELRRAERQLAAATRAHDDAASRYHACMKRSKNETRACAKQRAALDHAARDKAEARDAHRFAKAEKRQACDG